MNLRWRLLAPLVVILGVACLPAVASAAPPTPVSTTDCGGPLNIDSAPTPDDPYLVDYKFHCSEDITAYTLIISRGASNLETIDDFDPTPQAILPDGSTSATESVTCSAELPGNGVNCNAGAGGTISAWNNVQGSIDLVQPYCKYLPAGAKPGTLAVPQAVVQVVVTNSTGAQNGPFELPLATGCKKVPDYVPFPKVKSTTTKKTKKKTKKTKKTKHHATAHKTARRS